MAIIELRFEVEGVKFEAVDVYRRLTDGSQDLHDNPTIATMLERARKNGHIAMDKHKTAHLRARRAKWHGLLLNKGMLITGARDEKQGGKVICFIPECEGNHVLSCALNELPTTRCLVLCDA